MALEIGLIDGDIFQATSSSSLTNSTTRSIITKEAQQQVEHPANINGFLVRLDR